MTSKGEENGEMGIKIHAIQFESRGIAEKELKLHLVV